MGGRNVPRLRIRGSFNRGRDLVMNSASPCSSSGRFFAQNPDPEIYFHVAGHGVIWKALRNAVARGDGVVLLTGEPGVGKTMLLLRLKAVGFDALDMAILPDGRQESGAFLWAVLVALDATWRGDGRTANRQALFAMMEQRAVQGHRLLLAVDDAHLLTGKNMELLTEINQYRFDGARPVQLLLVGRPEAGESLREGAGLSLGEDLAATLVLSSLTPREVVDYVNHFMGASKEHTLRLTPLGWVELMGRSQGMPRRINRILRQAIAQDGGCVITGRRIRQVCPAGQYRAFPWDVAPFMHWMALATLLLLGAGFLMGRASVAPQPVAVAEMALAVPAARLLSEPDPAKSGEPTPRPTPEPDKDKDGADSAIVESAPEPAVVAPPAPAPPPRKAAAMPSDRPVRPKGMVHTVQTGSFSKRDNAEKVRQRLIKKGYAAYLQSVERGGRTFYSIRVDYSRQQTAEKASREIQSLENMSVLVLQNTVP